MKPLRPFFSYFGAKWRAAKYYPAPQHQFLIEPFAGSACYSLHHWDQSVLLIDSYPVIANLWTWLIGANEREVLALPDLKPGQRVGDLDVRPEARTLIGFLVQAAMTRPCEPSTWAASVASGRASGGIYWGQRIRERIAAQLPAIRHWGAICASYADLPNTRATWFIDPPYAGPPGVKYVHNAVDYVHLAAWCRAREGQAIVCENVGAEWLPFVPFRDVQSVNTHGGAKSREAVWLGGAP